MLCLSQEWCHSQLWQGMLTNAQQVRQAGMYACIQPTSRQTARLQNALDHHLLADNTARRCATHRFLHASSLAVLNSSRGDICTQCYFLFALKLSRRHYRTTCGRASPVCSYLPDKRALPCSSPQVSSPEACRVHPEHRPTERQQ